MFFSCFSGKFGEIWAKSFAHPKFSSSYTYFQGYGLSGIALIAKGGVW